MLCLSCHNVGKPKSVAAGSAVVELFLYLLTIPLLCIPGLIYSHWRTKNATKACKECGGTMIPEDSPRALELLSKSTK